MRVAVIGATGTAGSRVVDKLEDRGVDVAEMSRSTGVDLLSWAGLHEALDGVDAAVDVLPTPSQPSIPSTCMTPSRRRRATS